jgi:NAD(P)-dependent dehydrogenase (short-subunit alcohol dehydrogenase family)
MSKSRETNMNGKIALVTGATSGIGKEIARGLAKAGATVILGVRDQARGDATRNELARETGNSNIVTMIVDVSAQASLRSFAKTLTERHGHLSVLVNNAGAWFGERRESRDGREMTLATNVLGPHLLSALLLDALKAGAPARIINIVSSFAGDYDVSDLDFKRRAFDGVKAYSQSKRALRLLTWGLANRLEGSGVTVNAVAPGFVRTDIYNQPAKGFMARMMAFSARYFAVSPAKGAATPLWAAGAPELERVSGKYIAAHKVKPPKAEELAEVQELERVCDRLVGLAGSAAA